MNGSVLPVSPYIQEQLLSSPLHFLEEKNQFGTAGTATEHMGGNPGLEAAAHELIKAIGEKDPKAVAAALRNAFNLVDAAPHEEGEHT
jgi:hypothetical protein